MCRFVCKQESYWMILSDISNHYSTTITMFDYSTADRKGKASHSYASSFMLTTGKKLCQYFLIIRWMPASYNTDWIWASTTFPMCVCAEPTFFASPTTINSLFSCLARSLILVTHICKSGLIVLLVFLWWRARYVVDQIESVTLQYYWVMSWSTQTFQDSITTKRQSFRRRRCPRKHSRIHRFRYR